MVLIGGAKAMRDRDPDRTKIVTIDTEHAAVRDTVLSLEEQGFEPVLLPVGSDGLIVMDAAQAVIDERTAVVAGMLVNNEFGVIQPVEELRNLASEQGAPFFCDAVQGYDRMRVV